jgi:hypothetical protein
VGVRDDALLQSAFDPAWCGWRSPRQRRAHLYGSGDRRTAARRPGAARHRGHRSFTAEPSI